MPPAFVLSQDQTLQTKLVQSPKWFNNCFSRFESCLRNLHFDLLFFYYDSEDLAISKSDSGSSHYSIFKELFQDIKKRGPLKFPSCYPVSNSIHCPLTSQIFIWLKRFRASVSYELRIAITLRRLVTRGFNLALIWCLSNHFLKIFKIFKNSCLHRFSAASDMGL